MLKKIKNISFNNVQIHLKGENHRPAFKFVDVKNAVINNPMITTEKVDVELMVKDEVSENVQIIEP